jgi:ketosteroid isomerase-like protein
MRARLSFVLLLIFAGSLSAAQTKSAGAVSHVPPGAPAPSASDAAKIAEVMAFEKEMEAAVVRGDVAFLDRALSSDFLFTHGDGWTAGGAPLKVDTKASWLEYVKKQPAPYVYRELDSIQVELHGDIALTVGQYRYQPRTSANKNGAHLHVWFERVYVKRNGQWQHLSHRTVKGPVNDDD